MRFFIELSYRGTNYCGWQRQPDAPSVQQALEDALSTLLRTPTTITGAGRTDTGVHATAAVAHFDAAVEPDIYHLNALLPRDIAVRRVWQVADDAHARFDATEREYTYYITGEKDPFRHDTSWFFRGLLDVAAMNAAAAYLLGTQEFTTFSKLHSGNKTDVCTVFEAGFQPNCHPEASFNESRDLIFTIKADRFLRNMVRAIVGTLVDVGRGKITPEQFAAALKAKDRRLAASSAPAQGLFLTAVKY